MTAVVADTHTIIWYFAGSKKLSVAASAALDQAIAENVIYISAITLVEITYLVEKGKLPQTALEGLIQSLNEANSSVVVAPLDLQVVQAVRQISREVVPEMGDRIIAATALHLRLPLITCDSRIQALTNIETRW